VHVTSGLVAVIFSSIVFMNMINGAVLLGSPIRSNVLLGGAIGVLGIVLVFWPQLISFSLSDKSALGLVLSVVSTFMASLGNIISARHQQNNLPVIQTNAYGMAYGAALIGAISLISGKTFSFEMSLTYVGSLFYLSLFGTVIAFGCYLKLIGKIGADRASFRNRYRLRVLSETHRQNRSGSRSLCHHALSDCRPWHLDGLRRLPMGPQQYNRYGSRAGRQLDGAE
jgi:drug/metabolite transporter (DMT)-like permease